MLLTYKALLNQLSNHRQLSSPTLDPTDQNPTQNLPKAHPLHTHPIFSSDRTRTESGNFVPRRRLIQPSRNVSI